MTTIAIRAGAGLASLLACAAVGIGAVHAATTPAEDPPRTGTSEAGQTVASAAPVQECPAIPLSPQEAQAHGAQAASGPAEAGEPQQPEAGEAGVSSPVQLTAPDGTPVTATVSAGDNIEAALPCAYPEGVLDAQEAEDRAVGSRTQSQE